MQKLFFTLLKFQLRRLSFITLIIGSLNGDCQVDTTFKKNRTTDNAHYELSGMVEIETGKGITTPVKFTAIVPILDWDKLAKTLGWNDRQYFNLVASELSFKAQDTLKNTLSFEPFPTEMFIYYDGKFACNYNMMGRNGYGNMIEVSSLVFYNPEESGTKIVPIANADSISPPKLKIIKN